MSIFDKPLGDDMEEILKQIEALRLKVEEKEHEYLLIQQELKMLKARMEDAIAEKRVLDLKNEEQDRIRAQAKAAAEQARLEAEKGEELKEQEAEQAEANQVEEEPSTPETIDEGPIEVESVGEAQHEAIMRTIEQMSKTIGGAGQSVESQFEGKATLGDKASRQKLNDIKRGIGINERFLFANELFAGDMGAFSQAVDELNHVDSESDANRLMGENLSLKYNWDDESETVVAFKSLVSRRFA